MRHATVHEKHLKAFGEFLGKNGAILIPPIGEYEVLRAIYEMRLPIMVFRRKRGQVLTVSKTGAEDVKTFYRIMKIGRMGKPPDVLAHCRCSFMLEQLGKSERRES